jgi:hypothetical protein
MRHQAMMEKRKRGRPKGTTKVHTDYRQCVWVCVEVERRVEFYPASDRLLSISEACRRIAKKGGIVSAIGGNVLAIRKSLMKKSAKVGRRQKLRGSRLRSKMEIRLGLLMRAISGIICTDQLCESRFDDQVDSTSQALEWLKRRFPSQGIFEYYKQQATELNRTMAPSMVRLRANNECSQVITITGRQITVRNDRTIEDEARSFVGRGFSRV